MGTNFYWIRRRKGTNNPYDDSDLDTHIGKRSAAGLYCWECGLTLCKEGEGSIHKGKMQNWPAIIFDGIKIDTSEWYDSCPNCGLHPGDGYHAGMVELGFEKPLGNGEDRRGVCSVSSFTWTQKEFHREKVMKKLDDPKKRIVDEYGNKYTAREFKEKVLDYCPINFESACNFC